MPKSSKWFHSVILSPKKYLGEGYKSWGYQCWGYQSWKSSWKICVC